MQDFFSDLLNYATIVFAVSSMLSVGFSYTIRQIIGPLRHWRFTVGALLANFVAVPALAYGITAVFSLGEHREVGLLVVASAAGAPFLIKLTQIARSDVALAAGLLVMLLVTTIVYMPLVVPRIAPEADVSTTSIATPLVLTMLLPLVLGLILDQIIPAWTERLQPYLGIAANISLVVLVASTVIANFSSIVDVFGTGAILAALLFIAGAFVIGYVFGIPSGEDPRDELGLATAQRNIAAAMVVATQSIGETDTIVMVIVTSLAAMLILFPTAKLLSKHVNNEAAAGASVRVASD